MSTKKPLTKGCAGLHVFLSVPSDKEAELDAWVSTHANFMATTHTIGAAGAQPQMMEYHWSKGKELKDPMNPESGESGNVLYCMTELYAEAAGIEAHMARAGEVYAEGLGKFMEYMDKYAVHREVGSTVLTCFSADPAEPCTAQKGDTSLQASLSMPKAQEAEMDALWKEHEAWMRKTHTFDKSKDDMSSPRLTSFTICKKDEQVDAMDPSKGLTGNVTYIMSETYVSPNGIKGHMKAAGETWAEGFGKLMEKMNAHATFRQLGACTVVHTMRP